jgi:malonyl CoA-acyl carrier protein transacylase
MTMLILDLLCNPVTHRHTPSTATVHYNIYSSKAMLQVVKARGAAMAAAAAVPPGGRAHGMLSVVGLGDKQMALLHCTHSSVDLK